MPTYAYRVRKPAPAPELDRKVSRPDATKLTKVSRPSRAKTTEYIPRQPADE